MLEVLPEVLQSNVWWDLQLLVPFEKRMHHCNKEKSTFCEEVEILSQYPGVNHVWRQEDSSYLTVMDLYNKKIKKQFAIEIQGQKSSGLGKRWSK